MTQIEVTGPTRQLVTEWTDPETGEVVPEHWCSFMAAEAIGTDGQVHMVSAVAGIETDAFDGVRKVREFTLRRTLERSMREKGVWSDAGGV
jgi:hypothetical protein